MSKEKAGICRYQQVHRHYGKLPVNIVPLWACKVKENGGFCPPIALDKVIKDRTRYYGNKEKNIQVSKGGHH